MAIEFGFTVTIVRNDKETTWTDFPYFSAKSAEMAMWADIKKEEEESPLMLMEHKVFTRRIYGR